MAKRATQAERARDKHFSGIALLNAKSGQFSPLPWVWRRLQWLFTPREWQIYCYLLMRSGPVPVVWSSDRQIAADFGIGFRKIAPQLRALQAKHLIAIANDQDGTRFIAIVSPLDAVKKIVAEGCIPPDRLITLGEDLEVLEATDAVFPKTPSDPSAAAKPTAPDGAVHLATEVAS